MPETNPVRTSGPARRSVLKGIAAGGAAAGAFPLLAACTGGSGGGGGGKTNNSKSATLGSGASDDVPKKAIAAMVSAFQSKSGDKIKVNTTAHNDFQNKINTYLQGSPDDGFTWFAGYRMKYYASKGLVAPLDEVWSKLGADNFGEGIQKASTGDDGKKYFVPNYNYPWAVFYRKSVWQANGYEVPTTFDQLKTLCGQMKKDGLTPIGFADKDGWPAMGTFDYINMRLNGYDFHVDLMAHKKSWASKEVANVFDLWKSILPYHQSGALGLTWQEAAVAMGQKKSGMYLLGSFVTQQYTDKTLLADIDFFPFPTITEANGQDAVEAPIDGFMVTKKGGDNGAIIALMEYLGTADGQNAYQKVDPSNVATNKQADTSAYNAIQKKSQQVIANAKSISQFMDRDSLPAFANNVMIPALQTFVKSGSFDGSNVESQAKQLYAQQ